MRIFPAHRCLHGRVHRSSVAPACPTSHHMDLGIGVFRPEGSGNRHSAEASAFVSEYLGQRLQTISGSSCSKTSVSPLTPFWIRIAWVVEKRAAGADIGRWGTGRGKREAATRTRRESILDCHR